MNDLLDACFSRLGKDVRNEILDASKERTAENVFVFVDSGGRKKQVSLDSVLHEGSVVTVVSPLAGG